MPFDSKPETIVLTRLEKLQRLLWLAERATGDQWKPCECLHHDALADPILTTAGFPQIAFTIGTAAIVGLWLEMETEHADRILGFRPAAWKASYLRDLIAREEKNRE